ncbi:MAG: DUF1800 domain-containing protein [Pseudomonadota bacterium]|nr:DUF1800 domain-containing protein [Pseudomonadota bacterium]
MDQTLARRSARILFAAAMTAAAAAGITGCGGGGSAPATAPAPTPAPPSAGPTADEAARFLTQATFGPTDTDIARVQSIGYSAWIDEQFALPATPHLPYVQANFTPGPNTANFNFMQDSFWQQAIPAPDQLRQRVKFALSELVVVSSGDNTIAGFADGLANYADLLGQHAFGNYRQLIEAVATSPMMGIYLSHRGNRKANVATGAVPDENFAREVTQLFTIGLIQLNLDGTPALVNGQPVETYTNTDISGLARVFTGWSWAATGVSQAEFNGSLVTDAQRNIKPMKAYPQYHETGSKVLLGTTIPAGTSAEQSLALALDRLFNHVNLCPFVGKQLIQRFVTSNPSAAYTGRVAAACVNNGQGVRGDMKAMIRAILLDAEARDASKIADPQFGKVREPVLRLANWARCFKATSASGNWSIRNLDSASFSLGQQPWRSPSVFNFFRPGYVPPNTAIAAAGMVAPEFQLIGETAVAGYTNYMQGVVQSGAGIGTPRDVRADYTSDIALAGNADALLDRMNRCLMYGTMDTALRNDLRTAINAIALTGNGPTNRVYAAILLTMASPEYLVQK